MTLEKKYFSKRTHLTVSLYEAIGRYAVAAATPNTRLTPVRTPTIEIEQDFDSQRTWDRPNPAGKGGTFGIQNGASDMTASRSPCVAKAGLQLLTRNLFAADNLSLECSLMFDSTQKMNWTDSLEMSLMERTV